MDKKNILPNQNNKKETDAMSPEERDNLAIDNAMEKLDDEIDKMSPEEKKAFEHKAGYEE